MGEARVFVIGAGEGTSWVVSSLVVVLLGRVGGVGRTDGRSRLGNHAYLGARTRPCWSGHMMMMGSLLPGWDSRSAGARPFKLPRPPVTRFLPCRNLGDGLTAALQEPVA